HEAFAVFATSSLYGPLIAAVSVVVLGIRLRRGAVPPFLWALIASLLAFWIALEVANRPPSTVRYVYAGGALALLIGAEAARGLRISRTGILALLAVSIFALFGNLARLHSGAAFYRDFSTALRAQLSAIELASG